MCALSDNTRRQERTPLDLALAELARQQWGVVSVAQLCALGIGRSAVTRRVQAGRLRRVHRGVYAVGGAGIRLHRSYSLDAQTRAIASDPAWPRSELERRMRKLARQHGLPQPSSNHTLDAPDPPRPRSGLLLPNHHLVVETDGWDTHRTRHAFEDDRAKDAALTAAGYTVLRFTWRQLRDEPQTVADRLKAIMRRDPERLRRARGGPARV